MRLCGRPFVSAGSLLCRTEGKEQVRSNQSSTVDQRRELLWRDVECWNRVLRLLRIRLPRQGPPDPPPGASPECGGEGKGRQEGRLRGDPGGQDDPQQASDRGLPGQEGGGGHREARLLWRRA